jgi:hypothetical protein
VQRTQCQNDARSPTSGDVIRRIAEYAAGYADAKADWSDDVGSRRPRE